MRRFTALASVLFTSIGISVIVATSADAQSPVASPAPGQVVRVHAADYFYEPAQISVRPGPVTVEFTNDGPRRHTFNLRDLAGQTDLVTSARLVAGDTVSISFTVPAEGSYTMYCSEPGHQDQGHEGTLVASAGGAPAAQASQPPTGGSTPGKAQGRRDISPTLVALWFHVPFITAWIGFVILDAFVMFVPGLSRRQRAVMVAWSRPFAVVAVVVILATGIWQTIDNPFQEIKSYTDLSHLKETTTYGMALFWKHGFVLATFGLTFLARFILAPRIISLEPDSGPDGDRLHQALAWTSVANVGFCLLTLLAATRMIWELH